MEKSNLTNLLKTFSQNEMRDFREFLKSGLFNKRQAVSNLFEIISGYHPGFDSDDFSKESIFAKLFPGTVYNDSTFRVLTHYLTELAERFLVIKKVDEDKLEHSIQLQFILGDRKQYRLLEKEIKRSEDLLRHSDLEAEVFFSYKYRLQNEKTYQMFTSNYALYDKIIGKPAWEKVFRDLNSFYVVKAMIMYLNTISYGQLYNRNSSAEKFEEMFDNINIKEYENIPVIQLYYFLIKMVRDASEEWYFYKVKEILKKHRKSINRFDITGAYVNMSNYCRKKIQSGINKFEREIFELFKEELKERTYLLNDGTMSPVFFRNAVITGLTLKEHKWVKGFINKYKNELGKRYRENYYLLGMALFEFHAGNFETAMELNSRIVYDELYMKLNSKILQMQLLYETGSSESLFAALESFRHFLANNKLIPSGKRIQYSNFQKYLKQVLSASIRHDVTGQGMLLKSLLKENEIESKEWLIQKVREKSFGIKKNK